MKRQVIARAQGLKITDKYQDALSFSGRGYRPTINHEVGGVVTRMGDSVSGLNVGDSVIGFAFGTYSTHQRMSANLLCPVPSSDLQVSRTVSYHGFKLILPVNDVSPCVFRDSTVRSE